MGFRAQPALAEPEVLGFVDSQSAVIGWAPRMPGNPNLLDKSDFCRQFFFPTSTGGFSSGENPFGEPVASKTIL